MKIRKSRKRQIEEAIEKFNKKRQGEYFITGVLSEQYTLRRGMFDSVSMEFARDNWRKVEIHKYSRIDKELRKSIQEMERIMKVEATITLH